MRLVGDTQGSCAQNDALLCYLTKLNLASSLFIFGKGWAEGSRLCSDKVEERAWKDCRRLVTLSAIDAITLGARK